MFRLKLDKLSLENVLKFFIAAFLFLLPWQTVYIFREVFLAGTKIEYWTLNFYGTEILLWLIVILFMVWYWKKFRSQILDFRFHVTKDRVFVFSALLFTFYFLLSTLWSADKSLALQQSVRVMEAMLLFFILFLGPLKVKEAIKYLLLGSLVPAVLGIGQFLLQATFAFKWLGLAKHVSSEPGTSVIVGESIGRWLRAYGPFAHPNIFGGYIIIVLTLASVHLKRFKIVAVTNYLLLITALFFTFSRSALMVFLIGFFILLLFYLLSKPPQHFVSAPPSEGGDKRGYLFLFLIPYSLFLIILFSPLVQTRVLGNSSHEVASVTERVSGYGEVLQIFKTSPWLGVGAGNYTLASYNLNPDLEAWQYQPVHNVGLLLLVELGTVGVLLLLFVFFSFIRFFVGVIKSKGVGVLSLVGLGLLLTAYCLLLLFDHYLYTSYVGLALSGIYWGILSRDPHS